VCGCVCMCVHVCKRVRKCTFSSIIDLFMQMDGGREGDQWVLLTQLTSGYQ